MRFDKAVAIHVGTPSPEFTKWTSSEKTTKRICFHGLASLSTERGALVVSPEFEGFGNQWCVRIYPGGLANAGMVSVYLANMSGKAIEIDYGFSINDGNGKQVACKRTKTPNNFGPMGGVMINGGTMILRSDQKY